MYFGILGVDGATERLPSSDGEVRARRRKVRSLPVMDRRTRARVCNQKW
jgi:hypothetical protein